jgi:predicted nucleic acid-binding protein
LAWLHEDEQVAGVDQIFERVIDGGAIVPSLWSLEVANSLTQSIRRGRIAPEHRAAFLSDLAKLSILSDEHTNDHAWSATIQLADRYRLTVYDAAYLEVAQRRRLPLATLDEALRAAAQAAGVAVLP